MRELRRIALLTIFLTALGADAQQRCDAHARMIEDSVPKSVGERDVMERLLNPTVDRQLSAAFNPAAPDEIFRDKLKAGTACGTFRKGDHHFECRFSSERGSVLKVELERGRVTYLNRERSEKKEPVSFANDRAVVLTRRAAEVLGVPMRELGEKADVRALRVTAASEEGDTIKGESVRSELHVRFQRRIGGVPVAFSRLHAAVDARGEIARMHIRWPDFRLVRGLKAADARPREAVVATVLDEIDRDNRCGSLSRVVSNVVYARTAVVEGGEGAAAEEGTERDSAPSEFVPALLVTVIPVEQKEDSGVPQMPVQNYVFPLLRNGDRADRK